MSANKGANSLFSILKNSCLILFIVTLTAGPAICDTIKMKDGRVFTGIIDRIQGGIYIIKTADGPVSLMESEIANAQWNAEGTEKEKQQQQQEENLKKTEDKQKGAYFEPVLKYLWITSDAAKNIYGNSNAMYGFSSGYEGVSFGDMGPFYGGLGLSVLYGSAGGTQIFNYRDALYQPMTGTTGIKSDRLAICAEFSARYAYGKDPVILPYIDGKVGMTVNFDRLDSYYSEGLLQPRRYTYVYGIASAEAGIEISATRNFRLKAGFGYNTGQIKDYGDAEAMNMGLTLDTLPYQAFFADAGLKIIF